jgi:hypothetical protein
MLQPLIGCAWGGCSALVAAISHFPKLDTDLDVLGFGRNARLMEDEADAIWSRVRVALDSLVSHVPSSVTHNPPDGAGESQQ